LGVHPGRARSPQGARGGLDTMPAEPQVDWAERSIRAERSIISEIVGSAIGEIQNQTLDEVEQMIATAADQVRAEFTAQLNQLRTELGIQNDRIQAVRAEVEQIVARKRRAKTAKPNGSNGSTLLLCEGHSAKIQPIIASLPVPARAMTRGKPVASRKA